MPVAHHYLALVLSRWRLVVALVVAGTLGGWLFSTLILAQKPTFEAAARLNIVPTSEELGYASRFVRGSSFDGGAVMVQTYAEFARTRPVVAPIVERYIAEAAAASGRTPDQWVAANTGAPGFSPGRIVSMLNYGEAPPKPLREDFVDTIIENTRIESVEGTYLIRITVGWEDPRSAAWFANALADAIIARAEGMSRKAGTDLSDTLTTRLTTKRAELAQVLRQSRDLKASLGVVDIDRQKLALLEAQVGEQSQLTSDRAALQAMQTQVAGLKKATGGKLSSSQAALEQTLATEAPRVAGMKDGIAIREKRVAQITAQIATLGKGEDAVKTLDDRAAALQTEVNALTERVSFSETENLTNGPRIQLIERATPPLVRSSPKTLFNTILGGIAGCALAGMALLLLGPARPREATETRDAVPEPAVATVPEPVGMPLAAPDAPLPDTGAPPEPPRRVVAGGGGGSFQAAVAAALAPEPEPVQPPAPPIVRLVPAAAAPDTGRVFAAMLRRPADGVHYTPQEVAAQAPSVARWLGDALIPDGRPLLVAADGGDVDAQHLYQLLYDHLRARGVAVRTLDAVTRAIPQPFVRDARKPLLYGGGLHQSGREAVLATPVDMAVLVAVPVGSDGDAAAMLARRARDLSAIVGKPVDVIAIGG